MAIIGLDSHATKLSLTGNNSLTYSVLSIFNKAWNEKLNIKRAAEAAQEKVVREQAHDERMSWATQRDIRLNARKVCDRFPTLVFIIINFCPEHH